MKRMMVCLATGCIGLAAGCTEPVEAPSRAAPPLIFPEDGPTGADQGPALRPDEGPEPGLYDERSVEQVEPEVGVDPPVEEAPWVLDPEEEDGEPSAVREATGWSSAPAREMPQIRTVFQTINFPHVLARLPAPLRQQRAEPWRSSRALALSYARIWVVDAANGQVVTVDRFSGAVLSALDVGSRPAHVLVGPDQRPFVTVRDDGRVLKLSSDGTRIEQEVEVGLDAFGMALDAEGGTLYVALGGPGEVVALDAETLQERQRIGGFDWPRALALGSDDRLTVTQRGQDLALLEIDPATRLAMPETRHPFALRRGHPMDGLLRQGRGEVTRKYRAVAAAAHPVDGRVFVAHQQALPDSGGVSFEAAFVAPDPNPPPVNTGYYGGDNSPNRRSSTGFPHLIRPVEVALTAVGGHNGAVALPVRDSASLEPMSALLHQPSDLLHHPGWSLLFVAGKGTDNLLVFNTDAPDAMESPVAVIQVGKAPEAIAFSEDGRTAYVLNADDFTLSEVDLMPLMTMQQHTTSTGQSRFFNEARPHHDPRALLTRPLDLAHRRIAAFGEDPLSDLARQGRRLFTFARDGRTSDGGIFACAGCHPDGTDDGLIWTGPDGPRQTTALAGRVHDTAPYNWRGSRATLHENIAQSIERMGGTGLSLQDREALAAFLVEGLEPPPNPHKRSNGLTETQTRGQALFEAPEIGCAGCHAGEALTDGYNHDVGTGSLSERRVNPRFNTPTLRGLYHSAPYFHDGSAATLMEVLDQTARTMGNTEHLSEDQKQDLIAFLLTL